MRTLQVKLNNLLHLTAQWSRILVAHIFRPVLSVGTGGDYQSGAIAPEARLMAHVVRKNGDHEDMGILSTKVVSTAFVNYLVDQLQTSSGELAEFKWHGMGIGNVAENIADTALGTQVESRLAGTQGEGASPNIYRSTATLTASTARAITEHGIFRAGTGDVLMDRSVFPVINLASGDSIQFTYELTIPAGS